MGIRLLALIALFSVACSGTPAEPFSMPEFIALRVGEGAQLPVTTAGMPATECMAEASSPGFVTVTIDRPDAVHVVAVAPGLTTVIVTCGEQTASTVVAVDPPVVVGIDATPAAPAIPAGTDLQLAVGALMAYGPWSDVTSSATYASTVPSIATVSPTGRIHAASPGVVDIHVIYGDQRDVVHLTVTDAVLSSIAVTATTTSLPRGTVHSFVATGTYSDGSTADVTGAATWSSTAPTTASVTTTGARGVVTALALGPAEVRAAIGSITGSVSVNVTAATLVAIGVVAASGSSLPIGRTSPLTALGTYSDGTTLDLTTQSTFSRLTGTSASIDASGVVTGLALGASTFRATNAGVHGDYTMTVSAAVLTTLIVGGPSTLIEGTSTQLTATGTYSDGTPLDLTSAVTWASSDANVVRVATAPGSEGVATAVSNRGAVLVTATLDGVTASLVVSATRPPSSLTFSVSPLVVGLGSTATATVFVNYTDGSRELLPPEAFSYVSMNTGVVTVDAAGVFRGIASGSTTVDVTYEGVTDTLSVQVP